jgi:uncharacterized protein (UPF0333 family)
MGIMEFIQKKTSGTKKGQAALEYLMTYGWAIFIIVVVLAILAFYFTNLVRAGESCVFSQPGFSCSEQKPVLYNNASKLHLAVRIDNQQGDGVTLASVVCTDQPSGNIDKAYLVAHQLSDTTRIPAGGSQTFDLYCYDKSGVALQTSPNSEFRGTLAVQYKRDNEVDVPNLPLRIATASVSGTVLQG